MYELEKSKVQISEVTYVRYIILSHWERHPGLEIDFRGGVEGVPSGGVRQGRTGLGP